MWICLMAPPTFLTSLQYLCQKHQPWECTYCFLHIFSAAIYGPYFVNSAVKIVWGEGCAFACNSFSPINKHACHRALQSFVSFVREYLTFLLGYLSPWYHCASSIRLSCIPQTISAQNANTSLVIKVNMNKVADSFKQLDGQNTFYSPPVLYYENFLALTKLEKRSHKHPKNIYLAQAMGPNILLHLLFLYPSGRITCK